MRPMRQSRAGARLGPFETAVGQMRPQSISVPFVVGECSKPYRDAGPATNADR